MRFNKNILIFDMLIPSFILFLLMIVFHSTSLDARLASMFFASDSKWPYRDNELLEIVFHKGGVKLVVLTLVIVLGATCYTYLYRKKKLHSYLKFVLISSLSTILLVFIFKRFSTFPCPWNSTTFGGSVEKVSFLHVFSNTHSRQQCFPAGHSSGGYAFLSLYYGYCFIYGKRKLLLLAPGILIGLIFGVTQQIRGAHFLSHDFATIIVSIFSSWMTYSILNYYNYLYEV